MGWRPTDEEAQDNFGEKHIEPLLPEKQIPKTGALLGVLIVCIAHKESRI